MVFISCQTEVQCLKAEPPQQTACGSCQDDPWEGCSELLQEELQSWMEDFEARRRGHWASASSSRSLLGRGSELSAGKLFLIPSALRRASTCPQAKVVGLAFRMSI
eukprot:TRINITY_DN41590_c0_g1_i1.p1 TRINITY_DN41590_c0_g1~~TRINITY_DN41590_c0_g1_i1.p1  ORF type:complete len:106 (+),score=20.42 TRINITY_DN41590_c0_g1_i1:76-393(+)